MGGGGVCLGEEGRGWWVGWCGFEGFVPGEVDGLKGLFGGDALVFEED